MNMTCQNVRENFWGYQRSQIPGEVARSIQAHLETCSSCAYELEQFKQVDEALNGFAAIEPSPYFEQKLNAKLDEAENRLSVWGWASLWLKDRYVWTCVTLFLAATSLWLGFRHRQEETLQSMDDVVRIQDENLRPRRNADPGAEVSKQANREAVVPARPETASEREEVIPDEDLAVVENLDLLQDYDFLKDFGAEKSPGGQVLPN